MKRTLSLLFVLLFLFATPSSLATDLVFENVTEIADVVEEPLAPSGLQSTDAIQLDTIQTLSDQPSGADFDVLPDQVVANQAEAYYNFEKPSAPSLKQVRDINRGNGVTLTWRKYAPTVCSNSFTVLKYKIYRDGVLIATTNGYTLTYTDWGLQGNKTYRYQMQVEGKYIVPDAYSQLSDPVSIYVKPASYGSVLNVRATIFMSGGKPGAIVNWNRYTEFTVAYYRVFRNGVEVAVTTNTTHYEYNLPVGTHTYSVEAVGVCGSKSTRGYAQPIKVTACATPAPTKCPTPVPTKCPTPTPNACYAEVRNVQAMVEVDQCNGLGARITWSAYNEFAVNYYNVYRDGSLISTTVGTSHVDWGRTAGQSHVYSVEAIGYYGQRSRLGYAPRLTITGSTGGGTCPYPTPNPTPIPGSYGKVKNVWLKAYMPQYGLIMFGCDGFTEFTPVKYNLYINGVFVNSINAPANGRGFYSQIYDVYGSTTIALQAVGPNGELSAITYSNTVYV